MQKMPDEAFECHEEAIAVGTMLADAFVARVNRFPVATRRGLLLACRERLMQDEVVCRLLLHDEDAPPPAERLPA